MLPFSTCLVTELCLTANVGVILYNRFDNRSRRATIHLTCRACVSCSTCKRKPCYSCRFKQSSTIGISICMQNAISFRQKNLAWKLSDSSDLLHKLWKKYIQLWKEKKVIFFYNCSFLLLFLFIVYKNDVLLHFKLSNLNKNVYRIFFGIATSTRKDYEFNLLLYVYVKLGIRMRNVFYMCV